MVGIRIPTKIVFRATCIKMDLFRWWLYRSVLSPQLPDNVDYNITVTVANFLGFQSEPHVHSLRKQASDAEVIVSLGGSDVVYPSDTITLTTSVTVPECTNTRIAGKAVRRYVLLLYPIYSRTSISCLQKALRSSSGGRCMECRGGTVHSILWTSFGCAWGGFYKHAVLDSLQFISSCCVQRFALYDRPHYQWNHPEADG